MYLRPNSATTKSWTAGTTFGDSVEDKEVQLHNDIIMCVE